MTWKGQLAGKAYKRLLKSQIDFFSLVFLIYCRIHIPGQLNRARGKRDRGAVEHTPDEPLTRALDGEERGSKRVRVDDPVHRPPQADEQGSAARLLPMQQSGANERGVLGGGESERKGARGERV